MYELVWKAKNLQKILLGARLLDYIKYTSEHIFYYFGLLGKWTRTEDMASNWFPFKNLL